MDLSKCPLNSNQTLEVGPKMAKFWRDHKKVRIYRPVQPNLDFQCTYAFIKKISIFNLMIMKLGQNQVLMST